MKVSKFYLFFTAGLILFLTSTAYIVKTQNLWNTREKSEQAAKIQNHSKVIKFDHKLHVTDAGVACKDCHTSATKSVSAKDNLNPVHNDCASCHDVNDQKNCNLCHFEGKYKKVKPSTFELSFSHNFHVESQNKACTDCHTGLDKVKYAKESAGAFPKMENCFSCHGTEKANNNCESCHTNLTNLTPKNHLQPNFLNEHKVVFGVSSTNNNCMMCHSDNFCQVCHSTSGYTGENKKENFFAPYYTKEGATRTDRASLQKLNTVHQINYKFNHGLDANHKGFECKTCHEPATFCGSCHQNEGNDLTGVVPQSHLQPGFITLGVNTGGGLHSELAKKDIESCQSCHDAQGGDPTCVKCHYDNDGIKGTNPKTHEPGFLKDEKGIWHDTQGAVCFTCHSDANARPNGINGVGFCGYCHGNENGKK
jgi:hypothetical protein